MIPIPLVLPAGSIVTGEILRDYSSAPQRLSPDILQVMLPSGIGIDVGWLPAFDTQGAFQIVVFRGEWEDKIGETITARSPLEAANIVDSLARKYETVDVRPMHSVNQAS